MTIFLRVKYNSAINQTTIEYGYLHSTNSANDKIIQTTINGKATSSNPIGDRLFYLDIYNSSGNSYIPIIKLDVVNDFLANDKMRFTVTTNNGVTIYSYGCVNEIFTYIELGKYNEYMVNTCNLCDYKCLFCTSS